MKIQTTILLFTITLIIGTSCRTMYSPNMHNVPLIKEKNEIRSTIAPGNIQAAYGLTNGLGLMVNYQNEELKSSYKSERYLTERNLIEAGIGHFRPMTDNVVFEIYGGAGLGNVSFDNWDDRGNEKFNTKFARYFVQPNIGLSFKLIDFALSLRFVNLRYFDTDTSQYEYNPAYSGSRNLENLNQQSYSFLERGLTIRVGWKYVKVHFQVIKVAQLNSAPINFEDTIANLGLHVNIARRHKKTKTTL